jgi:hypothetical protein
VQECRECRVALVSAQAEVLSASTQLGTGESNRTLDRILAVLNTHNILAHYKEQGVPRARVRSLVPRLASSRSSIRSAFSDPISSAPKLPWRTSSIRICRIVRRDFVRSA